MVEVNASQSINRVERLYGIEFLRFTLSLIVLFFHFLYYGPKAGLVELPIIPFAALELLGNYSVYVFFIVSGLVIAFSAEMRTAPAFLAARFARLAPALFACGLITSIILTTHGWDAEERLITYANSVFVVPLYFQKGLVDPAYWSIVYEVRFYAIVLCLILLSRLSWAAEVVTICAVLTYVFWFAEGMWTVFGSYTLAQFGSFFAIGIIIYRSLRSGWTNYLLILAVINLVIAGYGGYTSTERVDMLDGHRASIVFHYALTTGGVITVILMSRLRVPEGLKKPLSLLGAMSYPLYLSHQEVGYVLLNELGGVTPPLFAVIVIVSLSLIFAYLVVVLVERPYGRKLNVALNRALAWSERKLPNKEKVKKSIGRP